MGYCLVGNINGKLEPINNSHRKYDAVEIGLQCLANQCTYHKQQRFNGINEFEIWTDEIQKIGYTEAKYWYMLGYDHQVNKQVLKAKDFNLKNSTLEYGCYECGVRHAKYQQWQKKLF